jgi:hypothetical protein
MTEREKIVEVMARGLCRLRIQSNLRYDTKVRGAAWLQQAEDAGWHAFVEEASAALTALETSGMAVVQAPLLARLGILAERMQVRVDAIVERDGDFAVAGKGCAISYLFAKSLADACRAASDAVAPDGKSDRAEASAEARSAVAHSPTPSMTENADE